MQRRVHSGDLGRGSSSMRPRRRMQRRSSRESRYKDLDTGTMDHAAELGESEGSADRMRQ